jgi:disease resistance protein RPM1
MWPSKIPKKKKKKKKVKVEGGRSRAYMAEAAVSFVIQRLADSLDKLEFHTDVRREVERLQDELRRMRCFLRDADAKQDVDERVCNWVSDIRNVAYDAEDLIDTFTLKISPLKKHFIRKYTSLVKEWKQRSKIAEGLAALRSRLQDISASRDTYGIQNIGEGTTTASETMRKLRRSSPRSEERDIIGLENDTAKLVEQLIQMGDRWSAVSIVGMGGIGKTTLGIKIYNHGAIRARFPSRAWIYVSQEFSARDILQRVIRQIASPRERLEALTDEELEDLVYENLRRKRYLVVLDDIWSTKAWDCLKKAFPADRSNGSRLLLTTRNKNAALHVDPQTTPYDLEFLSKQNSWELFCKKAFIDGSDTTCSPLLEEIGKEIVERCAGLPLAIIVIGGLLSRKRRPSEWERILNNLDAHFARDPNGVSAILALSYNDLPFYLKSCFFYLGHFPEDYSIHAHKLFRLWIAEGLIPHQGERMEDVAEDYLNELIQRNMVQAERMSVNGRVKQCRLHDLLRDLSTSKAKAQNFLQIPGDENFTSLARCRRHPIYSDSHLSSLGFFSPHLRSLLFFRVVTRVRYRYFIGRHVYGFYELSNANFDYISRNFRLLRILELEGISCGRIPSTIGDLIHLSYLGLKETNIQVLPSTLGSLCNLQTLDIARNLHLRIVPNVIWNMRNLRHLYMCGQSGGFLRIDNLKHLQTLSGIDVSRWKQNNSAHLTSLRKLKMRGNLSLDTIAIFDSISALLQLRSLYLRAEGAEFPTLSQLGSLHSLVKLHLKGGITRLPSLQEFPPNLSQLTLEYTHLEQVSIEVLEKLPKLSIFRLKAKSYSKEELGISANGFPQLEFLEFNSLESLTELKIEASALPRLEIFQIVNCKELRMLPEEMKLMTSLHELVVQDMPRFFVRRLQGVDLQKVQHIPLIRYM